MNAVNNVEMNLMEAAYEGDVLVTFDSESGLTLVQQLDDLVIDIGPGAGD